MRSLGFSQSVPLALAATVALLALSVPSLSGCSLFPAELDCARDSQCVRGGQAGVCTTGGCAFDDSSCPSGLRYDTTAPGGRGGQCVGGGATDASTDTRNDSGGILNDCGGTNELPARYGDPCGNCLLGRYACDGTTALRCVGDPRIEQNITADGTVSASSSYGSEFEPPLSVDGSQATSWFSDGPSAGATAQYDWAAPSSECLSGVTIIGNGNHANTDFRRDYGFANVDVQILDALDNVIESRSIPLPGTPDQQVDVDFDDYGQAVRLLFTGHESEDCGGFSELIVRAMR